MIETRQVGVSPDYFAKGMRRDYSNYRKAIARELTQNSYDAGSSFISFVFGYEDKTIRIIDDGCGMSREVILEKLLVLGESFKTEGSVGGFGKAKEILFFPHEWYKIFTRDILVQGKGSEYTIQQGMPLANGVTIIIKLLPEESISDMKFSFQDYLRFTKGIDVYIDNEKIEQDKIGRLTKSLGFADIYQIKGEESKYASIRVKGIEMFQRYIGYGKGKITVELKGKSTDLLTSNRDGLNNEYRDELDQEFNNMVVNPVSWDKKQDFIIEKYKGTGNRSSEGMEEKERELISSFSSKRLVEIFDMIPDISNDKTEKNNMEDGIDFIPDLYIKRKGWFYRDRWIKTLLPPMWKKHYKWVAKLWDEVLYGIMKCNDINCVYNIGFVFEEGTLAEINSDNSVCTFYINPLEEIESSKIKDVIYDIVDRAIHEIAHLRFDYHSEDFCLRMEEIRRKSRKFIKDKNLVNLINKVKEIIPI